MNDIVEGTRLASLDRCREWRQAMPRSYAAHWLCGAMWVEGAWQSRTTQYAHKVSPAQFRIMHERLVRARELLLEALELSPKPVQALLLLASTHFRSAKERRAKIIWRGQRRRDPRVSGHPRRAS